MTQEKLASEGDPQARQELQAEVNRQAERLARAVMASRQPVGLSLLAMADGLLDRLAQLARVTVEDGER